MRFLEIIYYSQYYELEKTGKDPQKGRVNGTLLSATIIILLIASAGMLLSEFAPHNAIVAGIQRFISGWGGGGRALGKLVAALLLVVIGGLLWFTVGSVASYNRIAEKYKQRPEEEQKKTIRQSLYIFLFTFGLFLLLVFII